jgi:hypothetical protein
VQAAVIATGADEAAALIEPADATPLARWARQAIPVRAACLDVALSRLPRPRALFALGIDRPLYLSVHSAWARLAPAGTAVIHVARYLGPEPDADPGADERELEAALDLVQPGWRTVRLARRFLPRMTVSHALASAAGGGNAGRPGSAVPGVARLHVAGDWVGATGTLADASLASAHAAARALVAALAARRAAA